ncbi:RNA methyltransferase [Halobacteriovorax sp. HLS]|uniref:TrmH family RNA methyltransferase n=1 Tax=Halobacteriovorax sp. HLS TaxID=2234000 RepID=UPI000FD70131|nr:RNA methyltransferase [Halobacteriovorax sp. HLS]
MSIITIEDNLDQRVSEFFSLRDKSLKENEQIIVETEKVILKLLNSDVKIYKIFASDEFYENYYDQYNLARYECFSADKSILQSIVGHNLHHGVMALAHRPQFTKLEELGSKVLIFNGLSSPENIGTMIRNAAAFNINSVIIDSKTCSPYVRRCIRVSMGNIFKVKVHKTNNLKETIELLRNTNYTVYATANQQGAIDLPNTKLASKGAIVIGSEGHGMDPSIIDSCDHILRIPINDEVAHLNAACSSAIFLYNFAQS